MTSRFSDNGWPEITNRAELHDWNVGKGNVIPLRNDAIGWSLAQFALWFNDVIEPLIFPGTWGWADRIIAGSTVVSNHASGTAEDLNAPKHPQIAHLSDAVTLDGFNFREVKLIHERLAWMHRLATGHAAPGADSNSGAWVWRWGWDYHTAKVDGMHFEYNRPPKAADNYAHNFFVKASHLPRSRRLRSLNPNAFGAIA